MKCRDYLAGNIDFQPRKMANIYHMFLIVKDMADTVSSKWGATIMPSRDLRVQ